MMQMMGGFTMFWLSALLETAGIDLNKEQPLALNAQLNMISKK